MEMTAEEQLEAIRKEMERYEAEQITWLVMSLNIISILMHGYNKA